MFRRTRLIDRCPMLLLDEYIGWCLLDDWYRIPKFDPDRPLVCVSDYAGMSKELSASAYSVLVFQPHQNWSVISRILAARRTISDPRRVKYNQLRSDGVTKSLWIELSECWRSISGVAVTIAFDKLLDRAQFWSTGRECHPEISKRHEVFDPRVRQHVQAVATTVATIAGGLAAENQPIHWISDDDDCVADDERARCTAELTSVYIQNLYGGLNHVYLQPVSTGPRLWEDVASLVDTLSGSTARRITDLSRADDQPQDFRINKVKLSTREGVSSVITSSRENRLVNWTFHFRASSRGDFERISRHTTFAFESDVSLS